MFSDRTDLTPREQSKEEVKEEVKELTIIPVQVSDEEFMANYRVNHNELIHVDIAALFKKKLTPEMIKQSGIGNCYFLSALANILRRDPDFLSKILQVTDDGKIAVSFYDANDVSKKYVYIIDPSKVKKSSATNDHTHDAIFLLEKAYAIHRLTLEPTTYTPMKAKIRAAILKCGKDASKTDVLGLLDESMAEDIKNHMERVDKYLSLEPEQLALVEDIYAIPVRKELEKNGYQKELAREPILKNIILLTEEHYKSEIDRVKKLMTDEKKDYLSALTNGLPDMVFRSLTGTTTNAVNIYHDDLKYFINTFMVELHTLPPNECSQQVQATLVRMFGNLDAEEARLFALAIQSIPKEQWRGFQEYAMKILIALEEKNPIDPIPHLLKALTNFADWSVANAKQIEVIMDKIQVFVVQHNLQKRGTGKYTPYQLELYDYIKQNLCNGCYITLSSKNFVTDTKKGLVSNHAYDVVNCYQQGNLFFVVLRNPWGRRVRDYERKDKIVIDQQLSVLGALERDQIPQKTRMLSFLLKSNSNVPINAAFPNELKLSQDGYFSVEISDVHKHFHTCYVGGITQHFSPQLDIVHKSIKR